ncbi:Slit 2 protein [Blomia tropicalis]|nr:Slit 2 protein [Blomia tropicalis]
MADSEIYIKVIERSESGTVFLRLEAKTANTIFGEPVWDGVTTKPNSKLRQVAHKVRRYLDRLINGNDHDHHLSTWLCVVTRRHQREPIIATTTTPTTLSSSSSPSSSSRIMSSITAMHFFTLAILCFILLGVHYSDAIDEYGVQLSFCPQECDCQGLTIDCARRGLTYVPKPLPDDVRRL